MKKAKIIFSVMGLTALMLLTLLGFIASMFFMTIDTSYKKLPISNLKDAYVSTSAIKLHNFSRITISDLTVNTPEITLKLNNFALQLDDSLNEILRFHIPIKMQIDNVQVVTSKGLSFPVAQSSVKQNDNNAGLSFKRLLLKFVKITSITITKATLNGFAKQSSQLVNLTVRPRNNKVNQANFTIQQINWARRSLANNIKGNYLIVDNEKNGYNLKIELTNHAEQQIDLAVDIAEDLRQIDVNFSASIPIHWTKHFNLKPIQQKSKLIIKRLTDDSLAYRLDLKFNEIRFFHPYIARHELDPMTLALHVKGKIDAKNSTSKNLATLTLKSQSVQKDALVIKAASNINWQKNNGALQPFSANIWLSQTPCKKAFHALPANLLEAIPVEDMTGSLSAHLLIAINPNKPSDYQAKMKNFSYGCNIKESVEIHSRNFLTTRNLPKTYNASLSGLKPQMASFLSNTFTKKMGKFLPLALLAAEDTGFLSHPGVEVGTILSAIKQNWNQGRFAIGGSTITMQVVKNLYLTNEKNLSRKLQELILAFDMESKLSKQEILEIYANIIEFGPGLYGVSPASKQFFNKSPADLSLEEALYLASILPNPKENITNFCSNKLSESIDSRLHTIYQRYASILSQYGKSPASLDLTTLNFFQYSPYLSFACPTAADTIARPL